MSERARLVVGIDVGGTKALAGLVGPGLELRRTDRRPTGDVGERELVELLEAQVRALQEAAGEPVEAVGLGFPGLLDWDDRVQQAPNLPRLRGSSPGRALAERLGIPVVTDNDGNCAAVAEHRDGAGRGHDTVVLLALGTGVGGGLVIGGRRTRGQHGMGAELGHVVVQADGPPCIGDCPNRGCLEAMASGTALLGHARRRAQADPHGALGRALAEGRLDGPLVTELAQAGDAQAVDALAETGRWLGVGMSSIANLLDPGVIVIGGGVSAAGELLIGPARDEFRRRAMPPIVERCEIVPAHFGPEAGLLGAAMLAHDAAVEAAP